MSKKRLLCLANSRKNNGRCVAGREVVGGGTGAWIRPISSRPGQEVSEPERLYHDGGEPQLGDIIEMDLVRPSPDSYQTENWLLNPLRRWRRISSVSAERLHEIVDRPEQLWTNGYSSRHGENDRVPSRFADALPNSLHLISASNVTITAAQSQYGGIRVRARFRYEQQEYNFSVTHPLDERRPLQLPYETTLPTCLLTISLGEPFHGFAYKLVAAVIPLGDRTP